MPLASSKGKLGGERKSANYKGVFSACMVSFAQWAPHVMNSSHEIGFGSFKSLKYVWSFGLGTRKQIYKLKVFLVITRSLIIYYGLCTNI